MFKQKIKKVIRKNRELSREINDLKLQLRSRKISFKDIIEDIGKEGFSEESVRKTLRRYCGLTPLEEKIIMLTREQNAWFLHLETYKQSAYMLKEKISPKLDKKIQEIKKEVLEGKEGIQKFKDMLLSSKKN